MRNKAWRKIPHEHEPVHVKGKDYCRICFTKLFQSGLGDKNNE